MTTHAGKSYSFSEYFHSKYCKAYTLNDMQFFFLFFDRSILKEFSEKMYREIDTSVIISGRNIKSTKS